MHTVLITNNHASFHIKWKQNFLNFFQMSQNIMNMIVGYH